MIASGVGSPSLRRRVPRNARRIAQPQSGAALIEFALVFILFFMILYGAIAYGVMFAVRHSLTQASAEGARAALQDVGGVPERMEHAKLAASDAVSWLGALAPVPQVTAKPCTATGYTCVEVSLSYDYASHPIIPPLPGMGIVLPATLAAQATVQMDAVN